MEEFRSVIRKKKIDLVFICQRMFGRLNDSSDRVVQKVAKYFKQRDEYIHIWERCILILAQANTCNFDDDDDDEDDSIKMKKVMTDWSIQFKEALKKYEVPGTVVEHIPVCATGKKSQLSLYLLQKIGLDFCMIIV